MQRVCELNGGAFCPFRKSSFNLLLSLMNIGFLRTAIATALTDCSIEKPFVFQTRRTTIMKKKLLVLGALLAIGANVNFVEASGSSTYTTAVEFKDESTSSSIFTNLTHLDNWPHFDKRGVTKIDGSVIQLHSTEPRQIDEPNQLTTLTGKELSFRESGQFLATYTMHGMDVSDHRKGITAVGGSITLYGHPTDYEYDGEYDDNYYSTHPERAMEFSIDNVDVGGQQIHGVLRGEKDTDAVNVSQLKELGSQVDINTNDITDLKNKLGNSNILSESKQYTDQRIAKAGAANAALSGLKYLDYDANHKVSAAASFGQYKGATAGAVGLAYQPNEDVLVHLGATVGSEHMLNGGVSIRVGDTTKGVKANIKNIAKEMDAIKAENNAIKAENVELKAELAEIKAMLTNK